MVEIPYKRVLKELHGIFVKGYYALYKEFLTRANIDPQHFLLQIRPGDGPPIHRNSHVVLIKISSKPAYNQPENPSKGALRLPFWRILQLVEAAIYYIAYTISSLPYTMYYFSYIPYHVLYVIFHMEPYKSAFEGSPPTVPDDSTFCSRGVLALPRLPLEVSGH